MALCDLQTTSFPEAIAGTRECLDDECRDVGGQSWVVRVLRFCDDQNLKLIPYVAPVSISPKSRTRPIHPGVDLGNEL
jgi:hypothetical protein